MFQTETKKKSKIKFSKASSTAKICSSFKVTEGKQSEGTGLD